MYLIAYQIVLDLTIMEEAAELQGRVEKYFNGR